MRAILTITILLATLLAGCAARKDGPGNKNISQAGALMVHPDLVGQPVSNPSQPAAASLKPNSDPVVGVLPKKSD